MNKFFAVLSIAFICLASQPAHAETYDECMSQSDGIVSGMVDTMWAQVDTYFHQGDYPRICALDRVITQCDPHFVDCYSTGGWLMDSLGRRADAEAFYQEGVRNNPTESAAYYSLGMFYYNTLKDYSAAAAVYKQDVDEANADVNDWKMLAHSYEKLKRIDDAVDVLEKAKSRWPNGPAVQVNLNRDLKLQQAEKAAEVTH